MLKVSAILRIKKAVAWFQGDDPGVAKKLTAHSKWVLTKSSPTKQQYCLTDPHGMATPKVWILINTAPMDPNDGPILITCDYRNSSDLIMIQGLLQEFNYRRVK